MVNSAEVEDSSHVIMGNLLVYYIPTKVLSDTYASHSFISRSFVAKDDLVTQYTPKTLKIISLGMQMNSNVFVMDASAKMGSYSFPASPIVLGNSDIDLILGMDFFARNKAFFNCEAKDVKLDHPSEDVIIFTARDDTIRLFSVNEKGEISAISQVPVVYEYEDVCLQEFPGMPPHRPIEFVIEIKPGLNQFASILISLVPKR